MSRIPSFALSLLLHGALAGVASFSLTSSGGGGGGGSNDGSGEGSSLPSGPFSVEFRENEERFDGPLTKDDASHVPPADEPAIEFVTERPPLDFDALAYEVKDGPRPQDTREGWRPSRVPSELRHATLPGGPSGAQGGGGGSGGGIGGGKGVGLGEGDGPADEVYTPAPSYPAVARRHQLEGHVVAEILVREDGTCCVERTVESSGGSLFEAAVAKAVASWKYRPKTVAGAPVESRLRIRFVFKLDR